MDNENKVLTYATAFTVVAGGILMRLIYLQMEIE